MKIKVLFVPHSMWIGFFWDSFTGTLCFCPLPMLMIKFSKKIDNPLRGSSYGKYQ